MYNEVYYDDPSHTYYTMERGRKVVYTSATQFLGHFHEKFDPIERSIKYAAKNGNTPEYWQKLWADNSNEACEWGTGVHNTKEGTALRTQAYRGIVTHPTELHNKCMDYYHELPDGIYTEMKMWHHSWHIAGRMDVGEIYTKGTSRYLNIEDHKTNKELKMNGYMYEYGPNKGKRKMMHSPIAHLEDCNYTHYVLQLSLYQFMGEHLGFQVGTRTLNHISRDGIETRYQLPYLKQEIRFMITHAVKNKILHI